MKGESLNNNIGKFGENSIIINIFKVDQNFPVRGNLLQLRLHRISISQ